jgi:hypothetical protein
LHPVPDGQSLSDAGLLVGIGIIWLRSKSTIATQSRHRTAIVHPERDAIRRAGKIDSLGSTPDRLVPQSIAQPTDEALEFSGHLAGPQCTSDLS